MSVGFTDLVEKEKMGCKSTKPKRPVTPPPPPVVSYKCPGCSKMVETDTTDSSKCARGGYVTFTPSDVVVKDANLDNIITCMFCGLKRESHYGLYGDCLPDLDMFWPFSERCCGCLLGEKTISKSTFSKKACQFCKVLKSDQQADLENR